MLKIFASAALAVITATAAYSSTPSDALVDADGRVAGFTEGGISVTGDVVTGTVTVASVAIDFDDVSSVQAACQSIMQTCALTKEQLIKLAARFGANLKIDILSPQELRNKRDCYLVDAMPDDDLWSKVGEITTVMSAWVTRMNDSTYVPNTEDDLAGIGLTMESWKRVTKRQVRSTNGYIEKNPAKLQKAKYKQLRVVERLEKDMPVEMLSSAAVEALTASPLDVDTLHGNAVNTRCASILATTHLCPPHFVKLVARFAENNRIATMSIDEILSIHGEVHKQMNKEVEALTTDIAEATAKGTSSTYVPNFKGCYDFAGISEREWGLLLARLAQGSQGDF